MGQLIRTTEDSVIKRTIRDEGTDLDYIISTSHKDKEKGMLLKKNKEGTLTGSMCKIKHYEPENTDLFGDQQIFYVGTNVVIKETIFQMDNHKTESEYTIYGKEKIDFVSLLLDRKLMGFKILGQPKKEIIGNLESGYEDDPFWIDSYSMCSETNMKDIMEIIHPYYEKCLEDFFNKTNPDVFIELPFSGSGVARQFEYFENKSIDDNKKYKRRITVAKNTSQRKIIIRSPDDFMGDLRSGDKIMLTDDIINKGKTLSTVYKRLVDNDFMKGRRHPVQDLNVLGYFVLIDSEKRRKLCFDGIEFIKIGTIDDILYAKANALYRGNPYKNEDIDKVHPEIEKYLAKHYDSNKKQERLENITGVV